MNREEAARYFTRQRDTLIWGLEDSRNETQQAHDAYNAAIDALTAPQWVKTSDRLPTEADADDEGKVTALVTGMLTGKLLSLSLYYKSVTADSADYFLPLPKLPEVEE